MGGKAQLGRFSSFLKSSRNQRGISIVHHFPLEGGGPVPWFPSSTLEGGVFVCLVIFLSPLAHGEPCKSQSTCLCCEFPWSVSFLFCALVVVEKLGTTALSLTRCRRVGCPWAEPKPRSVWPFAASLLSTSLRPLRSASHWYCTLFSRLF